jgi:hypothetical protein
LNNQILDYLDYYIFISSFLKIGGVKKKKCLRCINEQNNQNISNQNVQMQGEKRKRKSIRDTPTQSNHEPKYHKRSSKDTKTSSLI